eukprot:GHVU01228785.1.p2 GENE.GHVU01228785.1~~GHVU01228785.1.p2  ORF type:complete len:121 (-),score=1.58 GHVU01228785.1:543-905(-)
MHGCMDARKAGGGLSPPPPACVRRSRSDSVSQPALEPACLSACMPAPSEERNKQERRPNQTTSTHVHPMHACLRTYVRMCIYTHTCIHDDDASWVNTGPIPPQLLLSHHHHLIIISCRSP